MVRAFTHGAMGRRIDPSWGGPIDIFLVPASAPMTGVTKGRGMYYPACACKRTLAVNHKGRKQIFYLTMHSTHFIYGYMAADIW